MYVYIYMCCRGAETKKHMLILILNEIGNRDQYLAGVQMIEAKAT